MVKFRDEGKGWHRNRKGHSIAARKGKRTRIEAEGEISWNTPVGPGGRLRGRVTREL
jgi:hypothetical protein